MSSIRNRSRLNEAVIQAKILTYLREQNVFCFKVIAANVRGIPDICCIVEGKAVFFEVKQQYSKTSPIQDKQIDAIQKAKGEAYVVRSVDEVKEILENF